MKPFVVVLMLVAVAFFALAPATIEASTECQNGKCTLEVPVVAHVLSAEKAVLGTARRSVAHVGKAAVVAPAKVVAAIARKIKCRERKPVAKAIAAGGRLIRHRVACRR